MLPSTQCVHAGQEADPRTLSRAVPIALEERPGDWLSETDPVDNETVRVFERRVCALENGGDAIAFASGQAAITAVVLATCQAGDHIVSSSHIWGGAKNLFNVETVKWNLPVTYISSDDPADFRAAIRPNTKLVYGESVSNPLLRIFPFAEIAAVAREAGLPSAVDNTTYSPLLCRPLDHGLDIVLHSTTKYIASHGLSVGGIVVVRKGTEATLGAKVRAVRDELGGNMSAMNAFLALQGVATMHLRMPVHCSNAHGLARWFEKHPKVLSVCYPGLPSHPSHTLAKRYGPDGSSGMLGIVVRGGRAGAKKFVESLRLFSHLANIGDTKSLALHPASSTAFGANDDQLRAVGLDPAFVRLSIGIEHLDDLIADAAQALDAITAD